MKHQKGIFYLLYCFGKKIVRGGKSKIEILKLKIISCIFKLNLKIKLTKI